MKASSVPGGNSKFSFRTSTSKTSAPNERSAFATPRPVASETSRSEPGPPIKTAIFLFKSSFITDNSPEHGLPARSRRLLAGGTPTKQSGRDAGQGGQDARAPYTRQRNHS